jgi:multimeric flavodoxin WrbA
VKITILESSPHKTGASNTLADNFIRGAEVAGHTVNVFDVAHCNIADCTGCYLGHNTQKCVIADEIQLIEESLETSQMIVYVTPIYYYGMTSSLKKVIDRLHCFSPKLHGMKSLLLATAWREDDEVMHYLREYYRAITRYLDFENMGEIMAKGCGNVDTIKNSIYAKEAYSLGASL